LTVAFHDHERLLVIVENARVHELLAQGENLVGRRAEVRTGRVGAGWKSGWFHLCAVALDLGVWRRAAGESGKEWVRNRC